MGQAVEKSSTGRSAIARICWYLRRVCLCPRNVTHFVVFARLLGFPFSPATGKAQARSANESRMPKIGWNRGGARRWADGPLTPVRAADAFVSVGQLPQHYFCVRRLCFGASFDSLDWAARSAARRSIGFDRRLRSLSLAIVGALHCWVVPSAPDPVRANAGGAPRLVLHRGAEKAARHARARAGRWSGSAQRARERDAEVQIGAFASDAAPEQILGLTLGLGRCGLAAGLPRAGSP